VPISTSTSSSNSRKPDRIIITHNLGVAPFDLCLNLFKPSPPSPETKLVAAMNSTPLASPHRNPNIKSAPPRTQSLRKSQISANDPRSIQPRPEPPLLPEEKGVEKENEN
jgi:hypothetical protein